MVGLRWRRVRSEAPRRVCSLSWLDRVSTLGFHMTFGVVSGDNGPVRAERVVSALEADGGRVVIKRAELTWVD